MCLGVPGKIVETYEKGGLQMAKVGEYCIIHVGFAISLLSESEALETLELLKQIGSFDEEIGTG